MKGVEARIVVLGYHALSESWPEQTSVTPDRFQRQVESFLRRGYRAATFTEALTAPPARKVFAITFDDGASSVRRFALPLLEALGVPATMFVPTAYPDAGRPMDWNGLERWVGGPYEPELECMSWAQLRDLAERGWEIGSHTRTHPLLSSLGDEQLELELAGSRRDCERQLGRPCLSLAYPYGETDARLARAARAAGYATAATLPTAPATPLPLLWPRVGVYRGDGARRLRLRASRRALGAAFKRL